MTPCEAILGWRPRTRLQHLLYLDELQQWVLRKHRASRQLFLKGTKPSRDNKKVIENDRHLIGIKAGTIPLYTFERPSPAFDACSKLRKVTQTSQARVGLQGQTKRQAQGAPLRSRMIVRKCQALTTIKPTFQRCEALHCVCYRPWPPSKGSICTVGTLWLPISSSC